MPFDVRCLAARLPGSLSELETVVALAEQARSLEAAADELRTDDVSLATAVRWVRRRVRTVHLNLTVLIGLLPDVLAASRRLLRRSGNGSARR